MKISNKLDQYKDGIFYPKRTVVESTSKTRIQWFRDKLSNQDADILIDETIRLSGTKRLQQREDSFDEALIGAFDWTKSRLTSNYLDVIRQQGR